MIEDAIATFLILVAPTHHIISDEMAIAILFIKGLKVLTTEFYEEFAFQKQIKKMDVDS